MSERISVGDLVAVVRTCCVPHLSGTSVFVVAEIHDQAFRSNDVFCSECRASLPVESYATHALGIWGLPISWLKRIPPLSELESARTDEPQKVRA